MKLGFEDAAGEGKRPHPGWRTHSPCQNDLFTWNQRVGRIARLLTGALKGDSVAAARHLSAFGNLNGGLIGISAVATARHVN